MNFIAHLYLSGTDEGLIVGNFIADGVKGKETYTFPDAIQKGIILHRKIDDFTDHHLVFRTSKAILVPAYNHYAGVLVDIFYDHFLTKNWHRYSDESLQDFSVRCNAVIEHHWENIPEQIKMFYRYTKQNDRINGYNSIKTIESVLRGMSRRTNFKSNMELASKELVENYEIFESQFLAYFPDLQQFVKAEIDTES